VQGRRREKRRKTKILKLETKGKTQERKGKQKQKGSSKRTFICRKKKKNEKCEIKS